MDSCADDHFNIDNKNGLHSAGNVDEASNILASWTPRASSFRLLKLCSLLRTYCIGMTARKQKFRILLIKIISQVALWVRVNLQLHLIVSSLSCSDENTILIFIEIRCGSFELPSRSKRCPSLTLLMGIVEIAQSFRAPSTPLKKYRVVDSATEHTRISLRLAQWTLRQNKKCFKSSVMIGLFQSMAGSLLAVLKWGKICHFSCCKADVLYLFWNYHSWKQTGAPVLTKKLVQARHGC